MRLVPAGRRSGPLLLVLAAIAAGTIGVARAADEIHWTVMGQTSITVNWRGSSAENTIRYGLTAGSYTTTVTAVNPSAPNIPFDSPGPFWEARLTGLQEDTLYHYSIAGGPDHTFRTPPPRGSASSFTVYAEGDIAESTARPNMPIVQSLITGANFVLAVGDLTYANVRGQDKVHSHFNDVMVWSQDAAYMPAWGNHEDDTPENSCGVTCGLACSTQECDDLRNYKGRFDLPNQQASPGSPSISCCGEDWYWFDYGNTRFIAYSEAFSSSTWSDWNTRADAIMDAAQADPAIRFIVTFGHRPAYSSGHHSGSSTLAGYMDALGASHSKYVLNINGHSHNYERTYPQGGVVHLTVGTGGTSLYNDGSCLYATCTQPSWSAFRAIYHGVTRLRFTGTGIEGAFICGPPSTSETNDINGSRTPCTLGSVIDSFTIGAPSGGDTTAPTVAVTAPAGGATVSGSITPTATATDNVGVVGVQFRVDGGNVGAEDTSSPYTTSLNTATLANGAHTITAVARDAAGNTATSASVSVTVSNAGSTGGLITDPGLVFSIPSMPRPQYLVPVVEPTFKTLVTRIAGDTSSTITFPGGGSGDWGGDARHHYSKDQPWNADGTLIHLSNRDGGSPSDLLLDGNTYLPAAKFCSSYSAGGDRWHPTLSRVRVKASGTELQWFDVVGCSKLRTWSLPFSVLNIGDGEGNTSFDGRFVALHDDTRVFVVDMDPQPPYAPYPNKRIGPARDISDCGGVNSDCSLDWITVSASGKYVVVDYNTSLMRVFDINPDTLELTPRPISTTYPCSGNGTAAAGFIYRAGHADLTLNPFDNNEDVVVGREKCGNVGDTVSGKLVGNIVMVRLRDGLMTPLTDPNNEAYPDHTSARAYKRPGWIYVTYYPDPGTRFDQEIVAIKMDGSKAVERLAHHRSDWNGCFRCEAHSCPSPDGTRVLFASDWKLNCGTVCGSTSDIKAFVVDTRSLVNPDTEPPAAPTGLKIDP